MRNELYEILRAYGETWERYFEGRFIINDSFYKWAKDLRGVPLDEIIERARVHCVDLWHKDNCRGGFRCFVKNYNSFSIPKKPKEVRHRVPCRTCGEEYWLDERHDCGTDVEILNPNDAISLLTKQFKV